MKISIISITFNNYDELVRTLNSIPKSPKVEIVVINGGSCTRTEELLKTRLDINSITEPDRGIADAFNKGLDIATGDMFLFLNSGDLLIDHAYINWLLDQDNGDYFYAPIMFNDYVYGEVPIYPHRKNIGYGMPYPHQTLVVKREVIDRIGDFSLGYSIAMDYDFTCRMIKAGFVGVEFKGGPVVLMDGSGVSRMKEFQSVLDAFRALRNSGLIYRPNVFITFTFRFFRIFTRKFMEKVGLQSLVRKYKLLKARNAVEKRKFE